MASTRIHIDEARLGRVQKQDRIATGVLTAIVAIVMLIVVSMVAYILFEGISTLFQPGFLTQPARANGTQGGVLYQLFDSFYLLLITLVISVPISLGGAVFLVEYAPNGPIRDIASTAIETLSSLPSIVVGMFGFLVFSVQLGWKYSIIAGAVALRDELAPNSKIAVLSNGTRADRPEVHDALMMVDDNILKLDTVDPPFIQLLDQPVGPYDVKHQIETFASFNGHVIIQTMFLSGEYRGKPIDNTGEEYVGPWLAALERIRPQEATIYTVARETPVAGLAKAVPEVLDAIAARVRALGIPCQVSY